MFVWNWETPVVYAQANQYWMTPSVKVYIGVAFQVVCRGEVTYSAV
jgi:hypothetical protein